MEKIDTILDQIGKLSLIEAADLVKKMEEKFDISTAAPVAAVAAPQADDKGDAAADKNYDVVLQEIGAKKINVIKAVRETTSLGLKEAKDLVEKGGQTIKEALSQEAARELKKKLEEAGAKVELKAV